MAGLGCERWRRWSEGQRRRDGGWAAKHEEEAAAAKKTALKTKTITMTMVMAMVRIQHGARQTVAIMMITAAMRRPLQQLLQ